MIHSQGTAEIVKCVTLKIYIIVSNVGMERQARASSMEIGSAMIAQNKIVDLNLIKIDIAFAGIAVPSITYMMISIAKIVVETIGIMDLGGKKKINTAVGAMSVITGTNVALSSITPKSQGNQDCPGCPLIMEPLTMK